MNASGNGGFLAGLHGYEIVVIVLGLLLFLVGLWAVIQAVRKSAAVTGGIGIACVVISLVFVGYPSIKSFSVKTGEFNADFTKLDEQFGRGETPVLSRQEQQAVAASIENLAPHADTPQQKAILANAYRGIGDVDKAFALAEKVDASNAPPAVKSSLAPVFAAKLRQTVQDVPMAAAAKVDPGKAAQIESLVKKLDVPSANLSAQAHVTVAEGYAALGKDAQAATSLNRAQAIRRDVRVDPQLLQRLNRAPAPSG